MNGAARPDLEPVTFNTPPDAAGVGDGPVPGEPVTSGGAGVRGSFGRVAAVHRETRRGLVISAGFLFAAVVAGVVGLDDGWWLPLHLFAVGGLLTAISAVTQMLAVTWSTAPSPSPVVAGTQRWVLAAGAVLMVIGHEVGNTAMFVVGGVGVVAAMLLLASTLIWIRQRAVTDRFAPAIEAYVVAVIAGTIGMSIGLVVGSVHASSRFDELRQAHLTLNVFGLIGLVIAGTLPYFAATQVRSKMAPHATPAVIRAALLVLVFGVGTAAAGSIVSRSGVSAAGLIVYAIGLVVVAVLLPVYKRSRLRWAGPRVVQMLASLGWWAAMAVALAYAEARGSDDRRILQALVIGGFAQILVASLAYLGPVLRGGGHKRLTAGFEICRSWPSLILGNASAIAALGGWRSALGAVLVLWLLDVAVRIGRLLLPAKPHAHV